MAVDQERGSWRKARDHGNGFLRIEPDQNKAVPGGTVALGFSLELAEEGLLEFEDLDHLRGCDEGVGGGSGGVGEQDVFEVITAGGQDRSAFVDLSRIEQVEDGKMLNRKDFVHALDAEAAFAVEEVRDMGLFESSLLGEAKSG